MLIQTKQSTLFFIISVLDCGCNDGTNNLFPCFSSSDVNECEETNGGCEALCCNTIGSFYCRCPPGQKLNEDGKTCEGEYSSLLFTNDASKAFVCVSVINWWTIFLEESASISLWRSVSFLHHQSWTSSDHFHMIYFFLNHHTVVWCF